MKKEYLGITEELLYIMFHSFVILLKNEALNKDVLQDRVFSNISGLKQFLVRLWGIKLTKLLTSIGDIPYKQL